MSRLRHTAADEPHFIIRTVGAEAPAGHAIPPHAHSWHQLIYAAAGVTTVWTEQGSWVAPPTWAIWAPAGVAHGMRFASRASIRTLYLRPAEWRDLPGACAVIAVAPLLRELILLAVEIGMLDRREDTHRALATLIIDRVRVRNAAGFDLPTPRSEAMRRIGDELGSGAGVREVAQRHGLSARTLERRFAAETGMPVGRWRRQAQMLRALQSMAAGAAVKTAAHEAGYASPSAFVAAFRQSFGQSPARYLGLEH